MKKEFEILWDSLLMAQTLEVWFAYKSDFRERFLIWIKNNPNHVTIADNDGQITYTVYRILVRFVQ